MRRLLVIISFCLLSKINAQQANQYEEKYRPQIHFSPAKNWMNDPNGLVYQNGVYHLFFQHNPFGNQWGHMSWGHAISKDLLRWKELPIALQEENGVMIFSGSAVSDSKNSAGFATTKNDQTFVAIYTGHTDTLQTQNLAYSNDNGVSWKKYAGNPVLDLHKKDFRDPNVFWFDAEKKWILSVSLPIEHQIAFYASQNLKDWTYLSKFGPTGDTSGVWECPDLMQIPVKGKSGKSKWVLFTSQNSTMQYFVGEFDGIKFVEDRPQHQIHKQDYGTDYYAAVTYHQNPFHQPISIGWINNWEYANSIPTNPWKSAMSLPRKLYLTERENDWLLVQEPIASLVALRDKEERISEMVVLGEKNLVQKANCFEMEFDMIPKNNAISGIKFMAGKDHFFEIGYDAVQEKLYIDRSRTKADFDKKFAAINHKEARISTDGGKIHLHLYVDASIIELYAANGTIVFTAQAFPEHSENGIRLFSRSAETSFDHIRFWKLKSIWH